MKHLKKTIAAVLAILFTLSPLVGVPFTAFAAGSIVVSTTAENPETEAGLITLSVSLSEKVETKALALDFVDAYDHTVFEWVEGQWSDELQFSAMTDIDAENEVAAILNQSPVSAEGEIFTFTLRTKSGVACGVTSEVEVFATGIDGLVTEGVEVTVGHFYNHHCDEVCALCGEAREDAAHVYDSACDDACNDCGAIRTPPHSYDSEGDEICNLCGVARSVEYELITTASVSQIQPGDTVTVTVTLSKARQTRSFALDFLTAYNHDAFEWVSGDWAQSIKDLTSFRDVRAGSEAVFLTTSDVTVPAGEVFSFVLRVKSAASCLKPYELKVGAGSIPNLTLVGATVSMTHTYTSDCDPRCDRCELPRTPSGAHVFDDQCDEDCNVCGTTRIVSHKYEYPCSGTCMLCGDVRLSNHTYSDDWDDICNVCGEIRVILRDLTSEFVTDTASVGDLVTVRVSLSDPLTVNAAGLDFENAYDHTKFEWVDGYWSGAISFAAYTEIHEGVDALFLAMEEITVQGLVFTMILRVTENASCDTAYTVQAEGVGFRDATEVSDTLTVVHAYDNECDADCNVCGESRSVAGHSYDNGCDTDCNVCGEVRTTSHTYDNDADETCNECGEVRIVERDLITAVSEDKVTVGGTVTVTVSLSKAKMSNMVGLDLESAYDHDAFEWVEGDWNASIKAGSALSDVDPGKAAVFLASEEIEVSGEIFTFTLRLKEGAECGTSYEVKVTCTQIENVTYVGDTVLFEHAYTEYGKNADEHWLACPGCGEIDESTRAPHVYDHDGDEACVCGELRLAFFGTSLTLQHNFAINYKVKAELTEKYSDFYVEVEMNGKTVKITDYTNNGTYLSFRFEDISAQAIGDVVTATLHAKEGDVDVASKPYVSGVANYCEKALGIYTADSYAKFRTLIVDLLHYGAKAQIYTGYKTGSLVDANLTAEQLAWGTQGDPTLTNHFVYDYETIENPTATWYGAGLVLDSAVTLKLKFKADNAEGLQVRIMIEGKSTPIIVPSSYFYYNPEDGLYYLNVNGLNANQMSRKLHLTILDASGNAVSNTVQYSIESYAYEKQNSTIAGLADLVKAMMNYGNAAKAYAAK